MEPEAFSNCGGTQLTWVPELTAPYRVNLHLIQK
jgi:hypothetical protein